MRDERLLDLATGGACNFLYSVENSAAVLSALQRLERGRLFEGKAEVERFLPRPKDGDSGSLKSEAFCRVLDLSVFECLGSDRLEARLVD